MSTLKTTNITHGSNSGTANMVLAADGSMTFAKTMFASYAIICDPKTAGTGGGTPTQNAWTARALQTEIADPDSIVSIASNRFTLAAGNYLIKWSAPFFHPDRVVTRLYDHTNSAVIQYGQANGGFGSSHEQIQCTGIARATPSGSTAYELQYYADNSDSDGYGHDTPDDVGVCIFTVVEIYKEA